MIRPRAIFGAIAAVGATLLAASPALAFPDRPVTIIVPWAAGGGADTVTRYFVSGFQEELGVPVNVVNRPGGGGVVGHSAIANAEPDGYTLGTASPEIATYSALGVADLSLGDLDLISRVALIPAGVTVRADSGYESLDEVLAAFAEEPPGSLSSSGTGTGGSWHIAAAGMLKAAGMDPNRLKWVPSQGGAPALQDVVSGGITMFTGSPVEAQGLLDAGQVRVIAIMSEERSEAFPDVPTLKESGLDWTYANWFALVAPKGMDPEVRRTIAEAAERAQRRPEVQEQLKARGILPVWDGPGEFEAFAENFSQMATEILSDIGLAKN